MKKLLLLIFSFLCVTQLSAQQRVYCYITCPIEAYTSKLTTTHCCVDIGQKGYSSTTYSAIRDSNGNICIFNSPIEVLNMLTKLGWTIYGEIKKGTDFITKLSTYEWVMYRELREGETQESALSVFSQAQQKAK